MTLKAAASPHPVDVFASGPWRSATFTTFALSLSFFESIILRQLRAARCREVTVLVDPLGYRNSLIERQLVGAGCSYRLIPVAAPKGTFHLKFGYLRSENPADSDCLLIGSGNLTMGGYGNNAELIDVFLSQEQPSLFGSFARILDAMVASPTLKFPTTNEVLSIKARAESVGQPTEDPSHPRLVCSVIQPIGQAIVEDARRLGGCHRIVVLSPYFESLSGIERLWLELGKPPIAIALPDGPLQESRFPFAKAIQAAMPVEAVTADPAFERTFHAKLYELDCANGSFVVTGSANATRPALWTADNAELVVIRQLMPGENSPIRWMAAEIPTNQEIAPLSGTFEGTRTVAGTWLAMRPLPSY